MQEGPREHSVSDRWGRGGIVANIIDEQARLVTSFKAGLFVGLFFNLEDGGDVFLQNVC
jgi:hypothetical protein